MIKITINANYSFQRKKSFASKIVSKDDYIPDDENNVYVNFDESNNKLFLVSKYGSIEIIDDDIKFELNEVLLFYNNINQLRRFFRPSANSNAILLTEQCDQRCIMCSQPPKDKRYDDFPLFKNALKLCPNKSIITISGGEPTLFMDELLDFLIFAKKERPDITFHILSNGQHFKKEDMKNLKEVSSNVLWGIPLYSHLPNEHDDIVSKDGAYDKLFHSFSLLLEAGSRIELRTVLMKQNIKSLLKLSDLIINKLPWIEIWAMMQLEYIGYAKMNWKKIFFDNSENFEFLENSIIHALSNKININLYNFPLCTVPQKFRKITRPSISDWKKKFIKECENCEKKTVCAGFFEWHKNEIGYKNIGRKFL